MRHLLRPRILHRRLLLSALVAAGAVGLATPAIASAVTAPQPPIGPAPVPVTSPPSIANPIAPWTAALGEVIHSAPSDGSLPGGCATLLGNRVCVPQVTVDGTSVSQVEILEDMLGLATRPSGSSWPQKAAVIAALQEPTIQQEATASAVGNELLYQQGMTITNGSLQTARSVAQQELSSYLADPAAGQAAGIVPAGMSPQQYFLSAPVINAFQRSEVINTEESALVASHVDVGTWVRQQMATHTTLVNGLAPTFSLAGVVDLP